MALSFTSFVNRNSIDTSNLYFSFYRWFLLLFPFHIPFSEALLICCNNHLLTFLFIGVPTYESRFYFQELRNSDALSYLFFHEDSSPTLGYVLLQRIKRDSWCIMNTFSTFINWEFPSKIGLEMNIANTRFTFGFTTLLTENWFSKEQELL